ncbi:MAG: hypothetical protein OT478_21705 [Cyanobacteria bacterium FC1]|uniref:hypothetical protein n=1 Tax=Desertifilum tharense TaxID=1185873 RepID=UPI003F7EC86C|nr:hypothetical protein [Cyanobacteria bacterium FC1]
MNARKFGDRVCAKLLGGCDRRTKAGRCDLSFPKVKRDRQSILKKSHTLEVDGAQKIEFPRVYLYL